MGHLRGDKYEVRVVDLVVCQTMVAKYHYAGRGSNTATFRHGLFLKGYEAPCLGVAWWLPPTKNAARATYPANWRGVLALHRLVVHPAVPTNGASFLIGRSIRLIRQDPRWDCLVTYADEGEGHEGVIYQATNWEYMGVTDKQPRWVDGEGNIVSRLATKSRTYAEMREMGYEIASYYRKHKYRMVL